jgi:Tol biopolymer transport system component
MGPTDADPVTDARPDRRGDRQPDTVTRKRAGGAAWHWGQGFDRLRSAVGGGRRVHPRRNRLHDRRYRAQTPALTPHHRKQASRRPGSSPGRLFTFCALAVSAAVLFACSGDEPRPLRLVFYSDRDGDDEIYLMEADGTGVQQLTNEPGRDYEPDGSPDGDSILFASQREGGNSSHLYVMGIDGSAVRRLTFGNVAPDRQLDDYGEWSPDGERIVFQRSMIPEGGKPYADVWLLDPESGEERALTDTAEFWDSTPSVSADGESVLFESNRSGDFELYRMPIDGGEAVRLTESSGLDIAAKESPDGKQIAFVSDRDGDFEVYVIDADGSNVRQLTSNAERDGCPQWSPDGRRLVFYSERDGDPEIYVMNADGSDQRRLTESPGRDQVADWVEG